MVRECAPLLAPQVGAVVCGGDSAVRIMQSLRDADAVRGSSTAEVRQFRRTRAYSPVRRSA